MSAVLDILGSNAASSTRGTFRTADKLRDQVLALAEGHGSVLSHVERAWASITFSGARHTLLLLFEGEAAVEAAERMLEALPEHDFSIPDQLVADASVVDVERRLLPAARLRATVELLLLEED